MPSASTAHRSLVGILATVSVLASAAGAVSWRVADASATSAATMVPTADVAVEPPPSTTSSTASSTTTTSTSTTVKPRPVATTAAPRPTVPLQPPATTPATVAAAAPAPPPEAAPSAPPASERCAAARQWVAARGLRLPVGWEFRCPGQAVVGGAARWGMACWNCEGNGSWIAVDIGRIGASDAALRYVVAHETCHANDYMGLGISTEIGADLCAALHGAPRP